MGLGREGQQWVELVAVVNGISYPLSRPDSPEWMGIKWTCTSYLTGVGPCCPTAEDGASSMARGQMSPYLEEP